MFVKLPEKFETPGYKIVNSHIRFGEVIDNEFKGIEYLGLDFDQSQIFSYLPERYRTDFAIHLMRINKEIPPHTDTGILASLNFYIKTQDCKTLFYKKRVENPRTIQIKNQVDGFIFDEADLIKTESFIATDNDVFLLDVSQPHSVIPLSNFGERLAITLATSSHNFKAVCDMLVEMRKL
jgi:hypothetical protein